MAHEGPEQISQHLFEHLVIGLALFIPAGLAMTWMLKRRRQ